MGLRRRARRWRCRMEDFGLRIKDQEGRRRDAPQRGGRCAEGAGVGRWDIGYRNQAARKRRKRRLGRRLNHSGPECQEVLSPAGRGMSDPGGSADKRRRSRSPLRGGTALRAQSAVKWILGLSRTKPQANPYSQSSIFNIEYPNP